jgi:hypothetical protein
MLEAELMTSCRGVTCWDCGNEGRAFFEAGPATAAAAVGFVARAATGNITKRHLPCGMNLARALVFRKRSMNHALAPCGLREAGLAQPALRSMRQGSSAA